MTQKPLHPKMPQWFKDWHIDYFEPVQTDSRINRRLIYILFALVLGANTAGNHYHEQIINFFINLFGG